MASQMAAAMPPSHPFITADNHASLLNIVGWFSVVVAVLVVIARLGTRWAKSRTMGFDDRFILLSIIFTIAQTVTISVGVSNGLGVSPNEESASQLDAQQKTIYAFIILFIFGQFFTKFSIIAFVVALSPSATHRMWSWAFSAVVCVWLGTSVFGFAFQCDIPNTWQFIHNKCINRVAFYTFIEVLNIILDTALAVFPTIIVLSLQKLDRKRKIITIYFFLSRLFVVAASISQLAVIYSRTEDPFLSWTFALLVTVIQTLGILTACGPYLKPLLVGVPSGMIGNDDIRRRRGKLGEGYYISKDSKKSKDPRTSSKSSGQNDSSKHSKVDEESELEIMKQSLTPSHVRGTHKIKVSAAKNGELEDWDSESQSSRANIIRQTKTYRVDSDMGVWNN